MALTVEKLRAVKKLLDERGDHGSEYIIHVPETKPS